MNAAFLRFRKTHEQLKTMLLSPSQDEVYLEILQKLTTKYIALIVQGGDKELQQKSFDFFCQYNGIQILAKLMVVNSLLAIKAYSLLFINLKHQAWISFILCQPFLMEAIGVKSESNDEEWTEYFISFLKSLSIRINQSQITLFYNQKNCIFPLIYGAIKYFNHPDFMVRTSVMNIILEILKIKQKKSLEYFSRFPFTSYLITFVCQIHQFINHFHHKLSQVQTISHKQITNYQTDLSDYLYYFNDLITFGTEKSTQIIQNSIIFYLLYPTFRLLLSKNTTLIIHALFILNEMLNRVKNKIVIQTIALFLFRSKIDSEQLLSMIKDDQIYTPQIFREEFNSHSFYWNKYEKDIVYHCQRVFQDDPKVHDEKEIYIPNPDFITEITKISNFIHFDLLNNCRTKPLYILKQEMQQTPQNYKKNCIKEMLMQIYLQRQSQVASQDNQKRQIKLLLNSIITKILTNPFISKETYIQIQLSLENQQVQNMLIHQINNSIKYQLQNIVWNQVTISYLHSIIKMYHLINRQDIMDIQFQEKILQNYRSLTLELKELLVIQNMIPVVDHFYPIYSKIKHQKSAQSNIDIPLAVFLLKPSELKQLYSQYIIPEQTIPKIKHFIEMFFIYRNFIVQYFHTNYQAEYSNFGQEYDESFLQTSTLWKRGHKHRIINRILIPCLMESVQGKKDKKIMIVEDRCNLVLAQTNTQNLNCQILLNEPWKKVQFQLSKEDGLLLQIKIKGNAKEKHRLFFDDQVQSSSTLVKLTDIKWKCYQIEYSFIYKFIKQAITE